MYDEKNRNSNTGLETHDHGCQIHILWEQNFSECKKEEGLEFGSDVSCRPDATKPKAFLIP
jgi:hypothetical protein